MIILLVLSIVVVGNFLRDGESNYLEGSLLVVSPNPHIVPRSGPNTPKIVYIIAAVASWYYPNPDVATSNGGLDG